MLEHVFGSRTRVRLLWLFLNHPQQSFYVRELSRRVGIQINAVRRELENLSRCGFIVEAKLKNETVGADDPLSVACGEPRRTAFKKFFCANPENLLYPELRALVLKAHILTGDALVKKIDDAGSIIYLVLTGAFLGVGDSQTDLLIVGSVNRKRLARLLQKYQNELGFELKYTVMSKKEFQYRRDVTDRFLYSVLEQRHIVAVDRFNVHQKSQ